MSDENVKKIILCSNNLFISNQIKTGNLRRLLFRAVEGRVSRDGEKGGGGEEGEEEAEEEEGQEEAAEEGGAAGQDQDAGKQSWALEVFLNFFNIKK